MTSNCRADSRITVNAVSKVFPSNTKVIKAVHALSHVSFQIAEREVVCLLGPSGCGKSTILNIIAGFEAPSEGTVYCNGNPILAPGPDRTVVFQTPALFPWLTVADNIAFVLKHRGQRREDIMHETAEFIEAVDLKGFESHFPYQLSGGMRQRVSLARALIGRPSVLLLDEPFGALDAQTRLAMQELLQTIWKNYKPTIFFITHDIEEAIFLADRILVMTPRPGKISAEFTVGINRPRSYEVLTSGNFVSLKEKILTLVHSSGDRTDGR
jgi:NitT/TauT family transport system ATP-binding protein